MVSIDVFHMLLFKGLSKTDAHLKTTTNKNA